jgi:hypothetical protein
MKNVDIVFTVCVALAAAAGMRIGTHAAQPQPLAQPMAQPQTKVVLLALEINKPVSVIEGGVQTAFGVTDDSGALGVALDINKNYVIYKKDCSSYVLVVEGSEDDKKCRDENNQPAQSKDGCGRCVPAGYITGGRFRTPQMGQSGGGGGVGKVLLWTGIAAGAGAGVFFATRENDDSQSPAFTSIAARTFTFTMSGNGGCPGVFRPTANTRLVFALDPTTGRGSWVHTHLGPPDTTLNYTGAAQDLGAGRFQVTGTGTLTPYTFNTTIDVSASTATQRETFTGPCGSITYSGSGS